MTISIFHSITDQKFTLQQTTCTGFYHDTNNVSVNSKVPVSNSILLLNLEYWNTPCKCFTSPFSNRPPPDFCITTIFNIFPGYYVSVKSKLQHAPPGHLTFVKIIVQILAYPGQSAVQMPHTRVHSGDQIPAPRGHFKGTKMTEGGRKRLQLSNKIFINITKTEKHC